MAWSWSSFFTGTIVGEFIAFFAMTVLNRAQRSVEPEPRDPTKRMRRHPASGTYCDICRAGPGEPCDAGLHS